MKSKINWSTDHVTVKESRIRQSRNIILSQQEKLNSYPTYA